MTANTTQATQVPLWRKLAAGVCSLAAAVGLLSLGHGDAWKLAVAIAALCVAALVVHLPRLGPQVVARAAWWANLGLGTAFCVFGGSSERQGGLLVSLTCGAALLVIGRKGLAEASERAGYAPAAFRSSLLLLMALALADAQTFGLFAIISYSDRYQDRLRLSFYLLGAVAAVFTLGFVGLYRLRLWGAVLNLITAVVFALVVLSGVADFDHQVAQLLMVLCAGQVVAATPMMVGLIRGKPLPAAPPWLRGAGASSAVIALMLLSAILAVRW